MFQRIISQFQAFWEKQTATQKIVLSSMLLIFVVLVAVLVSWATKTSYSVAFSNLSDTDAGAIIEQLDTNGIPYKLNGTGTILVPAEKVYEVRLMMAREGLPESGSVGFELFSEVSLGMTEFTQKVNYQRALEGELERTILSLDSVDAVRVHIVTPEKQLLSSEQAPTTASITIQEVPSKNIDAAQIRAITYLVANAVEDLAPENVTVVDTNGNLLASGAGDDGLAGGITEVDNRRAAELAVATDLQNKVKSLLDTTLGYNKSVVQASIRLDWTEKQITTQQYDPDPDAVRSSQTLTETYSTDGTTVSGVPGATSNLPDDTTEVVTDENGNLVYLRTEETNNYEISSMESYETIHPGDVEQVSLSVLVDGVTDETQLGILEEAISAAAGINLDRGDVISVQTLNFDHTYAEEMTADLESSKKNQDIITAVYISLVVLVAIMIFWYISRLLRNLRLASVEVWEPVMKPVYQMAGPGQQMFPDFDIADDEEEEDEDEDDILPPIPDLAKFVEAKAQVQSAEEEQMHRVVSRVADENPASVAEIIQLWLNEDKQDN